MRIVQQLPRASDCVFREDFLNPSTVMDNGGIIVASTIAKGLSPQGASSRVAYNGTEALLINAAEMTIAFKVKTSRLAAGAFQTVICKCPNALNDNQFLLQLAEVGGTQFRPFLYIASSAADTANYAYTTLINPLTTYTLHAVYNGALAAASRVIWYINGLPSGTTISGTIPTRMRASAAKIGCPNYPDGVMYSLGVQGLLYWARIYSRAYTAAECLLDATDRMYS